MSDSQNSLYNFMSSEFLEGDLEQINTDELLNQRSPESMMNLSPSLMNIASPSLDLMEMCNFSSEQPVYPVHLNQLPIIETLETAYAFDICLNSESASKTSWMFSTKLNKVFVKINSPLNVYFKYNTIDVNQQLFVRAMVVYTSQNELADPVFKCPNHKASSRDNFPEHILRCLVPETEYYGTDTGKLFKDKLALIIPMSAIAINEPIKLQFTCQNSCSGGINRKMTTIVFTLEDEFRNIHGRQSLNFKVCSCPKRDKDKDEDSIMKNLPKKRKAEQTAPSTSKKIAISNPMTIVKQESDATTDSMNSSPRIVEVDYQSFSPGFLEPKREQNYEVTITMPSIEMKQELLEYSYNLIAGKMARTNNVNYQPYLSEIQKQIDDN